MYLEKDTQIFTSPRTPINFLQTKYWPKGLKKAADIPVAVMYVVPPDRLKYTPTRNTFVSNMRGGRAVL